jgi:hypothetical protein
MGEHGPREFIKRFYRDLGLCDENGRRHYDIAKDRNVLESTKAKFKPDDVSILDLAMGITGLWGSSLQRVLRQYSHGGRSADVLEAGPVVPSQFANISVWNAAVAGLVEVRILETYDSPDYISDRLARTIPTRKRTEKFIGIANVADAAVERTPGNPHARTTLVERYAETPETRNWGMAIEIAAETVMFDETGQVLQRAQAVTERLRLRKEKAIIDMVLGVTAGYKYNGTAYATYQATTPWINNLGANPLTDWHDVDEALLLFGNMTDQERSEPVNIIPRQILVMPARFLNARNVLNATQVWHTTNTAADQTIGNNPLNGLAFEMLPTNPGQGAWVYRRAMDADGLALSATNAKDLWFIGNFQRAFAYMENLPLTIASASPGDYEMADRRLVTAIFLDEMGVPAPLEPRHVVKCRNEA